GSDGTVGANKNSIKIIGDHTDMNAQGYFSYDSKKSGGITISYLRFGKSPIRAPYLPAKADFVALHNVAYIGRYDILQEIKDGGTFLLNSEWSNEEAFGHLTRDMQETIIRKRIKLYNIDALKISEAVGLGKRINSVMQAAFFKISGVLPESEAIELIKSSIKKSYQKKGEKIVQMNWAAVDRTSDALTQVTVPASIADIKVSAPTPKLIPDDASTYAKQLIEPIMHLRGDSIPVSAMPIDGVTPTATARLEKRGIAPQVPHWNPAHCIQCGQCSMVCPHAAIRTKQIDPQNLEKAPASFQTLKSTTKNDKNLAFRVQVYVDDCTACDNCVQVCPAKTKALEMRPIDEERQAGQRDNLAFFESLPDNVVDGTLPTQVKGTQFRRPLF
ncbi:MAG TPA: 2-oxoacid:acceptor oxidoreductase family protein, partial [Candidatus Aminicenantes bacterium]|nr:2-oxoacid:acceptor oxidoreductase family protein [Candidatus Aminicenantes bacterium]